MNKNFNEFCSEVKDQIMGYLPESYEDAEVNVNTVVKNNGQTLTGLSVRKKGSNISPNVYLESFFSEYEVGKPFDALMEKIASLFVEYEVEDINLDQITDAEKAFERIIPVLVNTEKNQGILKDAPHREVADLSVMYRLTLDGTDALPSGPNGENSGSVLINNSILKSYGLTEEELYQLSLSNMELKQETKPQIKNLKDILAEMMPGIPVEEGPNTLYFLGNKMKMYGANVLLSETFMQSVKEKIGDIYIIPSSIHECLAVPKASIDPKDLVSMVCEVNATQVAPNEILSNNVYEYTEEGLKVAAV